MVGPCAEPDQLQGLEGGQGCVGDLGDQLDVLPRREAGIEVVELEDEANMALAGNAVSAR